MTREKFSEGCDKVIRFSFYALIYFLPISVALIEIFSTLALVVFFIKRSAAFYFSFQERKTQNLPCAFPQAFHLFLEAYRPVRSPLNVAIGFFILANFISVIFSQYIPLSLKGFFFKVLQSTFIVFTFLEGMKTKGQVRIFVTIFMISATLVSINGLFQYFTGKGFIHGHLLMGGRVTSSFKHPNDFAAYLVVVLPIVLSLILYRWHISGAIQEFGDFFIKDSHKLILRGGLVLLLILVLVSLGLTFSRGAWLAVLAALFFFATKEKKIFFPLFIVVIIFSLIFIPRLEKIRNVSFLSDDVKIHHRDVERMKSEETSFWDLSKAYLRITGHIGLGMGRGGLWYEALNVIRTYPVFGSGLNTYNKVVSYARTSPGGYPHNCFLQMGAEIGIVGLAIFIWIICALYKSFFRSWLLINDTFLKYLSFGFITALTGFIVHSFFDTDLYSVQLGSLFWLFLGVILTMQKNS